VMVGVIGPIGSGLPQFGFPRRLAIEKCLSTQGDETTKSLQTKLPKYMILRVVVKIQDSASACKLQCRPRGQNQDL
jgi:hypothetical protein